MILPTIAAIIANVLDLGPAHGIGGATRLCEDLQRADGTRWNEAPKPGYNPLGKARDAD